MYSITFIMIAAIVSVIFVWVCGEYTIEAIRLLRVLAQEEEQRNQHRLQQLRLQQQRANEQP